MGDHGATVGELHRRLAEAGEATISRTAESFDAETFKAVKRFQSSHGLEPDGVCDQATWTALVEAGFRLGDRLLYLRVPYQRGEDVFELQRQLGSLGFHKGRVDGILGPETAEAIQRLQLNAGLNCDGICGPDTVSVLSRIRPDGSHSMGMLLERERLKAGPTSLAEARIAICGEARWASLLNATARALRRKGATVAMLSDPNPAKLAAQANVFEANACIGVTLTSKPFCELNYFATQGFESEGGKRLASLFHDMLAETLGGVAITTTGVRVPLLRESRMPAVKCNLGPTNVVVERQGLLSRGITASLDCWMKNPY